MPQIANSGSIDKNVDALSFLACFFLGDPALLHLFGCETQIHMKLISLSFCSPIWKPVEADLMQGTPDNARRAAISYRNITACSPLLARANAEGGGSDHRWFQPAFQAYIQGTSLRYRTPPHLITWVTQFPYRLPGGEFLSFAGPTSDSASALSIMTAHTACICECAMLEAEHDLLEGSTGKEQKTAAALQWGGHRSLLQQLSDESASHADSDASAPVDTCPVVTFVPPDECVTRRLQLSSGLHGSCSWGRRQHA